ncbi:MAG: DNA adenine methylase [Planctomycetes bacterium]|nr:DNA adenine methylase [Planctomycetota bacterium]
MRREPIELATAEDPAYLTEQLITCIGNKRALLRPIGAAVAEVKRRLNAPRLRVFDAFAGSGIVSRSFKSHASTLHSNDLEEYAAVLGRCFLRDRGTVDLERLAAIVADFDARVSDDDGGAPGFFEELYAPRDDARIEPRERVFYTRGNARRLDRYRGLLETLPVEERELLLGPLLGRASVHANTAGVFKGFYKDRSTRVGRFGGSGSDALTRILGAITLDVPVLSRFDCECVVTQDDANAVARRLTGLDLAYVDPPYNQHPYGSNYFMLNLLARNRRPERISRVSGIPEDWTRSDYNVRARSLPRLRELLETLDARFVLLSFNDEGFIAPETLRALLGGLGRVSEFATRYHAFRGSRNLDRRPTHVTEHLFLLEKA